MAPAGLFVSQRTGWNFMYHSRIVLSVGGSVRYIVRNLRCTVTIDSVMANSKTQNAFLFTVHAIFRHDYPLVVEPASTPRPLIQKKLWEILYLLICSFLPCLSWLLRSRVRKFRRDLWITLYFITPSNSRSLTCETKGRFDSIKLRWNLIFYYFNTVFCGQTTWKHALNHSCIVVPVFTMKLHRRV